MRSLQELLDDECRRHKLILSSVTRSMVLSVLDRVLSAMMSETWAIEPKAPEAQIEAPVIDPDQTLPSDSVDHWAITID